MLHYRFYGVIQLGHRDVKPFRCDYTAIENVDEPLLLTTYPLHFQSEVTSQRKASLPVQKISPIFARGVERKIQREPR